MNRLATALFAAAALVLAACGSSDPDPTPTACTQGSGVFLQALEGAPDQVTLEGGVALVDCLPAEQSTGELNTVGSAMVAAATQLNKEAERKPSGASATELGYLVGSIEEAASASAGIHTDLVRRINSAARASEGPDGLSAGFERTFGAGYAAAREQG